MGHPSNEQEPGSDEQMMIDTDDLDDEVKRFLNIAPVRAPVDWSIEDERVVIVYPKDFRRFERWLHRILGGPTEIQRPLDEMGTDIWMRCDGKHTIFDICHFMDSKYQEDIEPVVDRVKQFLEMLVVRNLIFLNPKPRPPKKYRVICEHSDGEDATAEDGAEREDRAEDGVAANITED